MKYLSQSVIKLAIASLRRSVHPFLGITYLTCKERRLAVGDLQEFALDASTKAFMERHHRMDHSSEYYFQPFKSSKYWVSSKYPSTRLHSINKRIFEPAFMHHESSELWGLREDYIDNIVGIINSLPSYQVGIPLPAIAIWTGKDILWPDNADIAAVVATFMANFWITPAERERLFIDISEQFPADCFSQRAPNLEHLSHEFEPPPRSPKHALGNIASLQTNSIGPAEEYALEFGKRLTLLVGDNGLGKTFLFDLIWWALTGNWANMTVMPSAFENQSGDPTVKFRFEGQSPTVCRTTTMQFDYAKQDWRPLSGYSPVNAVCIYATSDGGIAVSGIPNNPMMQSTQIQHMQVFQLGEIWDGRTAKIEGIVRDWASWQQAEDQRKFETFKQVLSLLSPSDLGELRPGKLTRVLGDPRQMPTITHSYGEVPIIQTSAGVRRILMIAYIIIWAWFEHRLVSESLRASPTQNLIVLLDELDAHLHPRWQRTVLPSILRLGEILDGHPTVQIVAATHSPMVMASMESEFVSEIDTLYHLELRAGDVFLRRLDFDAHGDMSRWFTSQLFGLKHARNIRAERAIEAAKRIQSADSFNRDEIQKAHQELSAILPPDDPFWRRWWYFAKQWGVD